MGCQARYNSHMAEQIEFTVRRDADGGYCARADVGETSIFTQGDSLDELFTIIEDALGLYGSESGEEFASFSMVFPHEPVAA